MSERPIVHVVTRRNPANCRVVAAFTDQVRAEGFREVEQKADLYGIYQVHTIEVDEWA